MAKDGLEVDIYKIDHFFQWGTPEDYEEFIYCMNEIRSLHQSKPIDLKDINLVLPIAGEGKRFSDKGYKTPKIFLEIQEKIIDGKLNKFFNENCLLGQSFVKDPDKSIDDLLKEQDNEILSFHRFKVGDGIDTATKDFAEEVAEQLK